MNKVKIFYKGKYRNYKICDNVNKRLTEFQHLISNNEDDPINIVYGKQLSYFIKTRITEKKKDSYNFSLKYPIDFRYLSFNHTTTLKLIGNIKKVLKIGKIQNALNDFKINLHIANIKFCSFCECRELKRQDKIRLIEAWE